MGIIFGSFMMIDIVLQNLYPIYVETTPENLPARLCGIGKYLYWQPNARMRAECWLAQAGWVASRRRAVRSELNPVKSGAHGVSY